MVDYIFTDNSGNRVKVRTDAVDTNTNNFTILEVNDQPGGFAALSTALQILFGSTSLQEMQAGAGGGSVPNAQVVSIGYLIALAVTVGMILTAYPVGSAVTTPVVVSNGGLGVPTLTAATGSGATGTTAESWTAVPNATNYVLDRATNSAFTTGVTLARYSGPLLVFNDSGLTGATVYYYRIRAQGTGYADSAESPVQTVTSHA
jgi:hypothetical protein